MPTTSQTARADLMVQRAALLEARSQTADSEDAPEMLRIAANLRLLAAMRKKAEIAE